MPSRIKLVRIHRAKQRLKALRLAREREVPKPEIQVTRTRDGYSLDFSEMARRIADKLMREDEL